MVGHQLSETSQFPILCFIGFSNVKSYLFPWAYDDATSLNGMLLEESEPCQIFCHDCGRKYFTTVGGNYLTTCRESRASKSLTSATSSWCSSWWWWSALSATLKGKVSLNDLASLSKMGRNCLSDATPLMAMTPSGSRHCHSWVIVKGQAGNIRILYTENSEK